MLLEHELLLAHTLGCTRSFLLLHKNIIPTKIQQTQFDEYINRYESGEPLPYILGYKEFYGRIFFVNHDVLIPRSESELLIDITKKWITTVATPTIFDIGTGSGCLAISAKCELSHANIYAVDIEPHALLVAQKNAQHHNAHITFFEGNLLKPIIDTIHHSSSCIILANLPYISTLKYQQLDKQILNHEPRIALDGGSDGLDLYRELFTQLKELSIPQHLTLLCEITPEQTAPLSHFIISLFPSAKLQIHRDIFGHERVMEVGLTILDFRF